MNPGHDDTESRGKAAGRGEESPAETAPPQSDSTAPPQSDSTARRESDAIDRLVRRVLVVGLSLSAALLCAGFVVWLIRGGDLPYSVPGPLAAAGSLASLEPVGFFSYGLLVLILTPFVRVAGSVVIFLRERDWRFTAVTAVVLASMIAGLVIGSL